MEEKLDEYIKSPFKTEYRVPEHVDAQGVLQDEKKVQIDVIERIHAYIFVFDSSNKKTFANMKCIIETIKELEKSKLKGGGGKGPGPFLPKMLCLGNKWDLRENSNNGKLSKSDIQELQNDPFNIKVKFVSALKNYEIKEAFKMLIVDLHKDGQLTDTNKKREAQ
jgi:hypothetical protein